MKLHFKVQLAAADPLPLRATRPGLTLLKAARADYRNLIAAKISQTRDKGAHAIALPVEAFMAARPRPQNDVEDPFNASRPTASAPALPSGGGGGTSDGMEARVAKLEAHMEHVLQDVSLIRADVGTLKTDMAATKVKIDNLPSKDFVVKVVVSSAAVLGALQVFGPFIAKLLGLK